MWEFFSLSLSLFLSSFLPHALSQGRIPIDPQLGQAVGEGQNYIEAIEGSGTFAAVMAVAQPLVALERR